VCPDANAKLFVTASVEARAERRLEDSSGLHALGHPTCPGLFFFAPTVAMPPPDICCSPRPTLSLASLLMPGAYGQVVNSSPSLSMWGIRRRI